MTTRDELIAVLPFADLGRCGEIADLLLPVVKRGEKRAAAAAVETAAELMRSQGCGPEVFAADALAEALRIEAGQ